MLDPTALKQTLEAFLASPDFKGGVISSTKAGWGGSDYRVELFPNTATWSVLWKNQIGNRYQSPGLILALPMVECDDLQRYLADDAGTEEDYLSEEFDLEEEDLKEEMRDDLADHLTQMEMARPYYEPWA